MIDGLINSLFFLFVNSRNSFMNKNKTRKIKFLKIEKLLNENRKNGVIIRKFSATRRVSTKYKKMNDKQVFLQQKNTRD